MPTSFKIYWSFNNVTLVAAICISIIYWAVLYDTKTSELSAANIAVHASNSLVMLFDMMIVSHPYRLLHVYQPLLFGVVYAFFTYFYYVAGGKDP